MSEYNIQMNKYNALNAEYDQLYPQPMKHASTHAKDGDDPITPSSIGAAELGADGKVPESQLPSMGYSKSETLSDTTKTLFGLDATAVPDDAFKVLSRFQSGLGNEYVWAKTKNVYTPKWSASTSVFVSNGFIHSASTVTLTLYNDVEYVNGEWVLINEYKTYEGLSNNNFTSVISKEELSVGVKYFKGGNSDSIYKTIPGKSYGSISTGDGWAPVVQNVYEIIGTNTSVITYGYVNSPDPNVYPPTVSDGYTYTALGQLGNKVQIATGSYTGTGTYGNNNPNSLTFDFEPKIVLISRQNGDYPDFAILSNLTGISTYNANKQGPVSLSWVVSNVSDNTIFWYSPGDDKQMNRSGQTYNYIAIG